MSQPNPFDQPFAVTFPKEAFTPPDFGLPHQVPDDAEPEGPAPSFTAPAGYTFDHQSAEDLAKAKAYAARHSCTILDAVAALAQGSPEFAAPLPDGFTMTRQGAEDLTRVRSYAREHGCGLMAACWALSIPLAGADK